MPVEPGLIGYAALALLALASKRHRHAVAWSQTVSPPVLRGMSIVLMLLSVVVAIRHFGTPQGIVAWTAQLCVAGAILVLLLSWRPRVAVWLGLPTIAVALL